MRLRPNVEPALQVRLLHAAFVKGEASELSSGKEQVLRGPEGNTSLLK